MKKLIIAFLLPLFILACGGNDKNTTGPPKTMTKSKDAKPKVDDGTGVGEFKDVALNDQIDKDMVAKGKAIYEM